MTRSEARRTARLIAALVREMGGRRRSKVDSLLLDGWLAFSPTEERVVLHLLTDGRPRSREEIATKLDEAADGRLRGILATLVARRVLLTTADGYRVNAPDGPALDTLRRRLEEANRPPPVVNAGHLDKVNGNGHV